MNKLDTFANRLREAGLSERQIDAAVEALNEYNNARLNEMNAQQGKEAYDDR